jgi:hypothetical protein
MEGAWSSGTSDKQRLAAGRAEGMKDVHGIFFSAEETLEMFHEFLPSPNYNP